MGWREDRKKVKREEEVSGVITYLDGLNNFSSLFSLNLYSFDLLLHEIYLYESSSALILLFLKLNGLINISIKVRTMNCI